MSTAVAESPAEVKTVVTATPGVKKTKTAKPKAKAKAKKAPAKKAKAKTDGQFGMERDHDLPWNDKKVAVFKGLRSSKLEGGAGTATKIAELAGKDITARDVRHYCYHAKAAGLVKIEQVGARDYHFSLTAKGRGIDPEKARKEQDAAKAS